MKRDELDICDGSVKGKCVEVTEVGKEPECGVRPGTDREQPSIAITCQ